MKLRKYQRKLCQRVMSAAAQHGSGAGVMMQLPTGGGKTAIGCDLMHQFTTRLPKHAHAWLTHRRELRSQSGERLEDYGLATVPMSAMKAEERAWFRGAVNIISPSLRRWPRMPDKCGLLIVDEAHHTPAASWARLVSLWQARGGIVVGLTATPWRLSRQQGFTKWYDELVCGPTVRKLQEKGWLATPRVQSPQDANIDFTHSRVASTGDFDYSWMESEVRMLLAHKPVYREWQERTVEMDDRRTLWFVPTVTCAERLCKMLGASARLLTAETPSDERDQILNDLANGRIIHLVSVDVISEGIDIPSVPVVASLRPTQSVAVWLQQCGRGSRPKGDDGGHYTVLDFAGNAQRHGTPDEDRYWSLEPRAKHPGGAMEMPGAHCHNAQDCADIWLHPQERHCWNCGERQWFECEACHVHRRWTQYPRGRVCRICVDAAKERIYQRNNRNRNERLNEKFASRQRARTKPEQLSLF